MLKTDGPYFVSSKKLDEIIEQTKQNLEANGFIVVRFSVNYIYTDLNNPLGFSFDLICRSKDNPPPEK